MSERLVYLITHEANPSGLFACMFNVQDYASFSKRWTPSSLFLVSTFDRGTGNGNILFFSEL